MTLKIYVASSWRNKQQPLVVEAISKAAHLVYDFRNPATSSGAPWKPFSLQPVDVMEALDSEAAKAAFEPNFAAMQWADVCVMVQPCGRSASVELGWCAGAGKRTIVLLQAGEEPELMLKLADYLCDSTAQVIEALEEIEISRCTAIQARFRSAKAQRELDQLGQAMDKLETIGAGAEIVSLRQQIVRTKKLSDLAQKRVSYFADSEADERAKAKPSAEILHDLRKREAEEVRLVPALKTQEGIEPFDEWCKKNYELSISIVDAIGTVEERREVEAPCMIDAMVLSGVLYITVKFDERHAADHERIERCVSQAFYYHEVPTSRHVRIRSSEEIVLRFVYIVPPRYDWTGRWDFVVVDAFNSEDAKRINTRKGEIDS